MQAHTTVATFPVIEQINQGVAFAYQWGTTAVIVFTAAMMAISILAWMIHR